VSRLIRRRHLPRYTPIQVCIKHLLQAIGSSYYTITQSSLLNENIIIYKYDRGTFVLLLDYEFTKYETRAHDRNTIIICTLEWELDSNNIVRSNLNLDFDAGRRPRSGYR